MAITRQVITSLGRDGTDLLGSKNIAVKIVDDSIVSGSLLTVESNHFCVLKSRGAVLNVYETGQYALVTPDKPLLGSVVQGFFGGASPWVYEVIYINRSKLLIRSQGIATSAEMAEMSYQVDYYVHVDSQAAALDLITHLPFNGNTIDTREIADYAGPAIEQAINQVVQVTKMEEINEHIFDIRENVKTHLTDFLKVLRDPAQRLEDPDPAQGRAHAGVDLVAGDRALADRSGPLLSSAPHGREGPGLGAQCGGRRAVQRGRSAKRHLFPRSGDRLAGAVVTTPGFTDAEGPERVAMAINLFYGSRRPGYNFYRLEHSRFPNLLRADDLLVRQKTGGLLAEARGSVEAAESAYRRAHLPPPSRANPRPDAASVAAAQALERLSHDIGALEGRVRAQPVPESDRMTQWYRDEAEMRPACPALLRLRDHDLGLGSRPPTRAESLRALVAGRDGSWLIENARLVGDVMEQLGETLRRGCVRWP